MDKNKQFVLSSDFYGAGRDKHRDGYYLAEDVLDEIDILIEEMVGDTE